MKSLVISYDNLKHFCDINDFIIVTDEMLKKENMFKNFVYETKNNFVNFPIYPKDMPILMNNKTWKKLIMVNRELKKWFLFNYI